MLLKADAALAAIVADRVYPPQRPAAPVWPFVGWGVPIVNPFAASCLDGNTIDVAVHAYAATEGSTSGEEQAAAIAERVAAVLSAAGEVDLAEYGCPYAATAQFEWQQTQVIQDNAEADAFHGIVTVRAAVAS